MKRKEITSEKISTDKTFVSHIESVGFTVSNIERAINFYTRILLFEKISDTEIWGAEIENLSGVFGARIRVARLRLGGEILELIEYLTPQGRAIPINWRNNDCWFQHLAIVVCDLDKAYQILRQNKVGYSSNAPQTLPKYLGSAAGIKAFYFKDFDNHILELIEFPSGKGKRKWRESAKDKSKSFLGIDHTAIVVADTQKSLEFYCDTLQMKISGESENYGDEQEHLNNVREARLRVTSLQTANAGIGVEILQYLSPTGGKPFPKDSQANDLWHWQTSFAVDEVNDLESRNFDFISNGVVSFESESMAFKKALLVRDADGHAVRIVEKVTDKK